MDGFSGAVHARHGWRLLSTLIEDDVRARVAVNELPDDGNVADRDVTEKARSICRGSHYSELLVRDVNGLAGRLCRLLPNQLVAGDEPSQARHDDGAPCVSGCTGARARG